MDAITESIELQGVLHLYALVGGGHDSMAAALVTARHPLFRGVVHLNTGIGIEATREYVREVCELKKWPLHEVMAGEGRYEELLFSRGGMPGGPKAHNSMLYYLKQQPLARWHRTACEGRTGFVTGIRAGESRRRMGAKISVPVRRRDRQVWVNPILKWTSKRVDNLLASEEIPRNPVVENIYRSGECLCGALAAAGEIHEIERWYPDDAERIHALEDECARRGLASVWGGRPPNKKRE